MAWQRSATGCSNGSGSSCPNRKAKRQIYPHGISPPTSNGRKSRCTEGACLMTRLKTTLRAAAAALALTFAGGLTAAHADEQYFPLQSYRVGPYAAGGTGFFGGFIDYMNLVNSRDGGGNGVKLTWNESETEDKVERGVECYQRVKTQGTPRPAPLNPPSRG